jgi:hypothetical protein
MIFSRPLFSVKWRAMGNNVLQLIDYHASRALEELDRAHRSSEDSVRGAHMELGRLHLYQAGWLRAAGVEGAVADRVD